MIENGQIGQRGPVMIELRLLLNRRIRDSIDAWEEAIEVVEAAVLRLDHDDGFDLFQAFLPA
jgi:hypothetical protein